MIDEHTDEKNVSVTVVNVRPGLRGLLAVFSRLIDAPDGRSE